MGKILFIFSSRAQSISGVLVCLLLIFCLETLTRHFWRPPFIGIKKYRIYSSNYGYGYKFNQPFCFSVDGEFLCYPTKFHRFAPQSFTPRKDFASVNFLTIGGSTAEGGPAAYTHSLQRKMESICQNLTWYGLNLAAGGYGSSRIKAVLKHALESLHLDFIIVDIAGSNEFEDEQALGEYKALHSGIYSLIYKSHFIVLLKYFLERHLNFPRNSQHAGMSEAEANRIPENRSRWLQTIKTNLVEMVELTTQAGVELILVVRGKPVEQKEDSYQGKVNAIITAQANSSDMVHLFDSNRYILSQPDPAALFYDGNHYNSYGHKLAASGLAMSTIPKLRIHGKLKKCFDR